MFMSDYFTVQLLPLVYVVSSLCPVLFPLPSCPILTFRIFCTGLDLGVFFGVPASGIFIPSNSVLMSRGTVTTIGRCGLQCHPLSCHGFMYNEEEKVCELAMAAPPMEYKGRMYSKLMRCTRIISNVICT